MRKFILSLVFFLTGVSAFAGVVTRSQAENVAKNVLGASSVQYVWNGLGDKVYGDVHPAFYVFDGNGQWAIIAADDCATPVLMHGEGTFNPYDMPDNMKSLLGEIEYNIFAARNQGLAQDPEIKQAWTAYSVMTKAGSSTPVEYLVIDKDGNAGTALWNQSSPYNAKCPVPSNGGGSGGHCYAGCVASAMAIIMRFHQWPEYGVGTIGGYSTDVWGYPVQYPVSSFSIDGYEYNWSSLPRTNVSSSWSQNQIDKVSDILFHCGAMVKMDYGPTGSGASTSLVPAAMAEHMSYSSNAVELYRSDYTNQQWFNMIKAELALNHPLLYSGQNKYANSGHAFVCDGYNSNNEVHINWGWGGSYNSWFAVCYLGEVGGEGTAVYSRSDSAIFCLVPDPEGDDTKELEMGFATYKDQTKPSGVVLKGGTLESGSDFSVSINALCNLSGSEFNGFYGVGLVDIDNNIKEVLSTVKISRLSPNSLYPEYSMGTCRISSTVQLGDRIKALYQTGETIVPSNWKIVNTENRITSSGISVIGYISPIDFALIDIPSVSAGSVCYPSVLLGNNFLSSVSWYVDGSALTKEYVKLTAGDHTFKAVITYTDNSTETIVKKVTVE